jgi:hypothetical protein
MSIDLATKENKEAPALYLSQRAFKKIHYWVQRAGHYNRECSGLGTISEKSDGYYVDNAWLIKPERIGQAHVDMDPMAVMELQMDLYEKKIPGSKLRFHWHSHAHFGVGWSGVDEETCRNLFCTDAPWTISMVVNVYGHHLARMDFPATKHEPIHNLPVRMVVPWFAPMRKELEKDFLAKCAPNVTETEQIIEKPKKPLKLTNKKV